MSFHNRLLKIFEGQLRQSNGDGKHHYIETENIQQEVIGKKSSFEVEKGNDIHHKHVHEVNAKGALTNPIEDFIVELDDVLGISTYINNDPTVQ